MKNFLMSCIAVSFLTPFVRADITQRLNIATQDGTVNTYPYKAKFSNGSVTDNMDGTVSITSGGGGGGSSTLAVSAGVQRSSPTSDAIFPSSQFVGSVSGSSMTITLNSSSVTLQGVVTAASLGALTANQNITWTGSGDVTGSASGATSISPSLSLAATQGNVRTFTSSETISGAGGLGVTYNVNAGSMTGAGLSSCSGGSNAVTWSNSTNQFGCNSGFITGNQSITLSGDVSGSGTTAITTTANATQANIRTFTSSETITGGGGLGVTYGVTAGSVNVTGVMVVASSVTISKAAIITSLTEGTSSYGTDSSSNTVTPDASLGNNFYITLNSTVTFNGPSSPVDGQKFLFRVTQDAVGSHTATWATGSGNFAFGSDITSITLSTAANAVDYIGCIYDAPENRWHPVAVSHGF